LAKRKDKELLEKGKIWRLLGKKERYGDYWENRKDTETTGK
jgi:hypothetical protein